MYNEVVLVGVALSLIFSELTGLSPAGLVVPGYIASLQSFPHVFSCSAESCCGTGCLSVLLYYSPLGIFTQLIRTQFLPRTETEKSTFVRMFMKVMLCENADWLLSEEAFSIYASCMYHPTYKDYKGQMDDLLCDPSTKVFVYEDQGRKTGMIILKFSDAAAEIIGIAVSVDARRKGIGKQLIRRVMELDDLECVKAQTDDDSIGFYRKCGFSEEKIVIEYPDGPAVRYNCVLYK